MIGRLSGTVVWRSERSLILDVGGVGYKVFATPETLKSAVDTLWTYLAVRENALDLYGFSERNELDFFELLLGVSGIGPKSALAILALAPPETLAKAIAAGDSSYLVKVSGIGRKNAEKIILELKEKVASLGGEAGSLQEEGEAIEALVALGYNLRDAREALRQTGTAGADTGAKIKAALKILGK